MLNRIFKTILVLSICVGISLPTNAAVSVSDGSAFVTKAEFAADLNNLSNRMAQLENSLDAKIDSLVSSYLTRNGIWNGAGQQINYLNQVLNGNTGANEVDGNCWLTWFKKGRSSENKSFTYQVKNWYQYRYNIIASLNKTGMLFGNYLLDTRGYSQDIQYFYDSPGFSAQSASWQKSLQTYLSWYESDGNSLRLIQRQLIYNFVFPDSAQSTTYKPISGYPISGTLQGFVAKGNSIYLVPEFILNAGRDVTITMNKLSETFCWEYVLTSPGMNIY